MNAINAAERNRIATIANAEAMKAAKVKEAEAEAEARHLAGQGMHCFMPTKRNSHHRPSMAHSATQ